MSAGPPPFLPFVCKHCHRQISPWHVNTAVQLKVYDTQAGLYRYDGPFHSSCAKAHLAESVVKP